MYSQCDVMFETGVNLCTEEKRYNALSQTYRIFVRISYAFLILCWAYILEGGLYMDCVQ
jgi:hypothetical protein